MLVRYLIVLWLIISCKFLFKLNGMYFLVLNCIIYGYVLVVMYNRNILLFNILVMWCYVDFWSYVKVFIEICGSVYVWIIVDVSKDIIL